MVSAPPVPVFPFRRAPSARLFRPRPCQFSRFVARHPPDVSAPARAIFPVSSRAIRPSFPPLPCRFPVSSRAIRPTFPPRPCHFPASSRAFRPTLPFVRPVSRCVVRYSFGVSSRPSRLPFCPFSRFLRTVLSFFRRVLLYSTNIFALWRFASQTVTLGFRITPLCCAVACVCTLY